MWFVGMHDPFISVRPLKPCLCLRVPQTDLLAAQILLLVIFVADNKNVCKQLTRRCQHLPQAPCTLPQIIWL